MALCLGTLDVALDQEVHSPYGKAYAALDTDFLVEGGKGYLKPLLEETGTRSGQETA